MTPYRISRANQPHLTSEPIASDVLPYRISRVHPNRISRVTQPHLTCDRHVRCGLSTGIKHWFTSTDFKSFSTVVAARPTSTGQQLVPSLRDGDGKIVSVLSMMSKSKSIQLVKKAWVQV